MTQEDFKTKATVRISNELFQIVKRKMHYGQFSLLFRAFFTALKNKIEAGKTKEIYEFMYGEKEITLNSKKGDKDNAINGQD